MPLQEEIYDMEVTFLLKVFTFLEKNFRGGETNFLKKLGRSS